MANSSGLNSSGATGVIQDIISGGAIVRALSTLPSYSDVSGDLSTYEVSKGGYSSVTVAEADWTLSAGSSFSDGVSLSNDNELNFGQATEDWGEVKGFAIDPDETNVDAFLLDGESAGTITEGVKLSIEASGIDYSLGPSA